VADVLLTPTKIYVPSVLAVLRRYPVNGIVHVTGGGLLENTPRILPIGCQAVLDTKAWDRPPIFDFLGQAGRIERDELHRAFNMGLGLLLVVAPSVFDSVMGVLEDHGETPVEAGRIEPQLGNQKVALL
jgi:phosphoribosylformylglycinamidine cyclo-ligase